MQRKRGLLSALVAVVICLLAPSVAHAASTQAMFRLYNPYTGEHLYTASANERDSLARLGWQKEGQGWTAPTSSSTPVYRLYNPYVQGGDHHYTTNKNEYDKLRGVGWRQEGIGWYSDDAHGVTLYRLYNPYAKTGTHHYTADAHERDVLASRGWRKEGTAWYGVKTSSGGTGSQNSTGQSGSQQGNTGTSSGGSGSSSSGSNSSGASNSGSSGSAQGGSQQATYYTVSFNTQGGSSVPAQRVRAGGRATRPANPTRSGYVFQGWYASASGTRAFDFNTPINGNVTAYAHWTRKATYSYEAYYVDGMGSTWYDGSPRTIYIKTNNPQPDFTLKDPQATRTSEYALGSGYFDDVADQGQVDNCLKVPGGYLVRYAFGTDTMGRHTIEIRELDPDDIYDSGTVAATFTANFLSYEDAQDKWADDAIARYTNSSMNPLQKLKAVCDGLGTEFHYYPNHDGYRITLAAKPNSPYFVSKRWDSYTSPAALCIVAEHIGGFSVIDNCYDNWPRNDPMWADLHASVRVVYNGEQRYFDAYPSVGTASGEMDPSSIVMLDFNRLSSSQFQHV